MDRQPRLVPATGFVQLGQLEDIERARGPVGVGMGVDVDDALK
jgi:hypothetical protein